MFDNRYQAVLADTEKSKKIHFQLRYQVYCLDKRYEESSKFKEEMEHDQYDENSVHFLIRDRKTGEWLATMRLVIGPLEELPVQDVTSISNDQIDGNKDIFAEVSRLSIVKEFRHNSSIQTNNKDLRTNEPEIMLGLIRAASSYCARFGVQHWIFLCKRSLKRVLQGCGLTIRNIGPVCQHKGARYPYWADLKNFFFTNLPVVAPTINDMFNSNHTYSLYSDLFEEETRNAA